MQSKKAGNSIVEYYLQLLELRTDVDHHSPLKQTGVSGRKADDWYGARVLKMRNEARLHKEGRLSSYHSR